MPDQIRRRGENNGGKGVGGEEETGGEEGRVEDMFGSDCAAFDPCRVQPRLI